MHLVDFETFNRLPEGTIFAPYAPSVLKEGLAIKVDHGQEFKDFGWSFNGVMPLEPWNLCDLVDGESIKATFEIYDGATADYMDYKQFLILDECDIDRMIQVLQWAKAGCSYELYDEYDADKWMKMGGKGY